MNNNTKNKMIREDYLECNLRIGERQGLHQILNSGNFKEQKIEIPRVVYVVAFINIRVKISQNNVVYMKTL